MASFCAMKKPIDLLHPGGRLDLQVRGACLITLRQHTDHRGPIAILGQGEATLPFEANRIFLTYNVTGGRGAHAHRECQQLLLCPAGSVTILLDDGTTSERVTLSAPWQALYVPPMVWAEQYDHSPDAVLMVAASHPYAAEDYLRTLEEWRAALVEAAGGSL
jgi:UDP-2-acetamido-3-amino-2,3-dideoxy-glucuronate N-acetyltransferase